MRIPFRNWCDFVETNHAINKGKITVFGGMHLRPNFHVRDCAELYVKSLEWPVEKIDGRIFNAGYQNLSINAIAEPVRSEVGKDVEIVARPTADNRSVACDCFALQEGTNWPP
jgi:nucleoside-diphosphate-sugar epimerase